MIASITATDTDDVSVRMFGQPVTFVSLSIGTGSLNISVAQAQKLRDELAAALRQPLELEEVAQ